jgi:tetratricopeptide (TPR) repeat protein
VTKLAVPGPWSLPALTGVVCVLLFTQVQSVRERISLLQTIKAGFSSSSDETDCRTALIARLRALQDIHSIPVQAGYRSAAFNLKSRGCADQAEAAWLAALKRDPADRLSAAQLGLELQERGRLADSDRWLIRAGIGMLVAWRRIDSGESAIRARDFPVAVDWLRAGVRLGDLSIQGPPAPHSTSGMELERRWREQRHSVLRDIGLAYYAWRGHLKEAQEFYRLSLQDSDSPYTRSLLAQALMQDGCSPEAISLLSRTLETHPDYKLAFRLLSWAHDACGDHAAAVHAARTALRLPVPITQEERYEFGAVLWKARLAEDALEQWRIALRESPQHPYRSLIPDTAARLLESGKRHE